MAESTPTLRSPRRHVILGNPANRRVSMFQAALARTGHRPAEVISYLDLLSGQRAIDPLLDDHTILRIESPGEDFDVEKHLIALGAKSDVEGDFERIDAAAALAMAFDEGRLRLSRQWYHGYRRLMDSLATTLQQYPDLQLYNAPPDIALMFDKRRCQRALAARHIPVPPLANHVGSYEELLDVMTQQGWQRAFVKLSHSSSAAGVIAIHRHSRGIRAVTSMEMERRQHDIRFYNNLKLRTYHTSPEIARLVNYVCREGAQVEQWLPKAALAGCAFDLRILVVAGKACHVVVRQSSSPMTNLHLGNRRGDVAALKSRMGTERWAATLDTAERAATVLSNSLYAGVDLLLQPGFRNPTVLELNAFGDLLPGVQHQGRDTYEVEILARANGLRATA